MRTLSKTKSAIKRRTQRRNETRQEKIARLMRRDLGEIMTQEIIDRESTRREAAPCICEQCLKTVKPELYEEGYCPECYELVSEAEEIEDNEFFGRTQKGTL